MLEVLRVGNLHAVPQGTRCDLLQWQHAECNQAVEGVGDTDPDVSVLYRVKTSHISPARAAFYKKWERLLSLEEEHAYQLQQELWVHSADRHVREGRVVASLSMVGHSCMPASDGKLDKHTYDFGPHTASYPPRNIDIYPSIPSFAVSSGDRVIISSYPGTLCLARGRVVEVGPRLVRVETRRPIPKVRGADPRVYRVDKDQAYVGMSQLRSNLANMFVVEGDIKRLELVVDLRRPDFHGESPTSISNVPHLNNEQTQAIESAVRAKDYTLIRGMPGTGKTSVIVQLIRRLVRSGKAVLLTAYTHSAVDNVLIKLNECGIDYLRLGDTENVS